MKRSSDEQTPDPTVGRQDPAPGLLRRICDDKFRQNQTRYLAQCLLAAVSVALVILFLDTVRQTVLIAALGSSSFVAFTMPRRQYARPRYLIGGYVIGAAVGCTLSLLEVAVRDYLPFDAHTIAIILGALATGLAMFLMVLTDTEHPPAAAVALGFVLNDWDLLTVLVILIGISAIALIKELIKPRLIDLL